MKISILVHNLSSNCIVRTYPIAKVLEKYYEIEVIGPVFSNEIYEPYSNEFHYKAYPLDKNGSRLLPIQEILKSIEGNVVYAFKPMIASFGIGLLAKYLKNLPLILDIEDWDAVPSSISPVKRLYSLSRLYNPRHKLYSRLMEPLTKLADEIIVVSNFLQKQYGGIKLPHGTDCSYFDPTKYDRESLRRKWGFDTEKLILFAGASRPHKGLEELLLALKIINSDSIRLLVVGKQTAHLEMLKELGGNLLISIGPQPHSRMPEFLKIADLVVLPQRKTAYAEAQVPGKVFEAMAMEKLIIATAVSDLPEILESCGWLVEPQNVEQLAERIQYVFDYPQEAKEKGQKAREKCKAKYSYEAMEKILLNVFRQYE